MCELWFHCLTNFNIISFIVFNIKSYVDLWSQSDILKYFKNKFLFWSLMKLRICRDNFYVFKSNFNNLKFNKSQQNLWVLTKSQNNNKIRPGMKFFTKLSGFNYWDKNKTYKIGSNLWLKVLSFIIDMSLCNFDRLCYFNVRKICLKFKIHFVRNEKFESEVIIHVM